MKKLIVAGIVALGLALTGCGANNQNNGYAQNGGYSDRDWDMNYQSPYNNMMYCNNGPNGVYYPMANGSYYCAYNNGHGVTKTKVTKRPKVIIPPKSQQKAPIYKSTPKSNTQPKSNSGSSYKSNSGYKSSSSGSSYKSSSSGSSSKSYSYKK
ncbi:hypothetical protein SEA_ATUIN_174 [Arthrobacter phage Atuin]|nr:hypothetical protein SEA_ATUIN_273 [Arthrobacter phage Atuin]